MKNIDLATNLRRDTIDKIKVIQSDSDLTGTAKANRIAEIRTAANDRLTKLRRDHEQEKAKERDSLYRSLLGLSFPASATRADKEMARLNYRDALFRSDTIKTPEEALRMLGRSRMTGDKELGKAIAARAFESGWQGVLRDYASASESIADNLQELIRFEQTYGSSKTKMNESMLFSNVSETPEEAANRPSFQSKD